MMINNESVVCTRQQYGSLKNLNQNELLSIVTLSTILVIAKSVPNATPKQKKFILKDYSKLRKLDNICNPCNEPNGPTHCSIACLDLGVDILALCSTRTCPNSRNIESLSVNKIETGSILRFRSRSEFYDVH